MFYFIKLLNFEIPQANLLIQMLIILFRKLLYMKNYSDIRKITCILKPSQNY